MVCADDLWWDLRICIPPDPVASRDSNFLIRLPEDRILEAVWREQLQQ
jgi:hypothetical protein